jgi:rubrerythrin
MVWDVAAPATTEELLHIFEAHVRGESQHIDAYRGLAASSADPVVAMLMDLVLEDEERHHDLFRRMTGRLREDVEALSATETLTYTRPAKGAVDPHLSSTIEEYARDEVQGARELRRLARESRTLYGGLFGLLLETMADDSEKHERVMRFVLKRIEG